MSKLTVGEFKLIYSEFAEVSEFLVQYQLDYAGTTVSKDIYGPLCQRAHGLLTAHYLKLSGADDEAAGKKKQTNGQTVASYSVDDVSRSFDNTAINNFSNNAPKDLTSQELVLTEYGKQFLALRNRLGGVVATTSQQQPPTRPW